MKKNYFSMVKTIMCALALMFVCLFTSCTGWDDPVGERATNVELKWDNIVKTVIDEYGILEDYIIVFEEGSCCGYHISNDTLYVTYPKPGEPRVDTIWITETEYITDTIYVPNDHGYVVVTDYGTENTYIVVPGEPNDTIFITFKEEPKNVEERYDLEINPTYDNAKFASLDPTSNSFDGVYDLRSANNRHGEISCDADTIWLSSSATVMGSATRKFATRRQAAGTRGSLNVAKDSCVYTFDCAGAEYKMTIAAESLEGVSGVDGTTKHLLYAAPQTGTYQIDNFVDYSDTIHHEGKVCYKVRQLVTATYTSTILPERGTTRTHNDEVIADNASNEELPVVYLIGDDVPVIPVDTIPVDTIPTPIDTTHVTPGEPEGFVFPDGEYATSAQISVIADRNRKILVEGILIHTTSDIYMIVEGVYVGSVPCTDHSLYNSMYMQDNGQWIPAYLESEPRGIAWLNQKGGSKLGGLTKDKIDSMMASDRTHITTNYASNFVRWMSMVNVGKTTTFVVDGDDKFTASSSTVK